MRRLAVAALVLVLVGPVAAALALAARTGTPETRLPGWEAAGFTAPFSYENTRCYDACAEQIARMKAEEAAAKKKAEDEAAAKAAAVRRAASRTKSAVGRSRSAPPPVRQRRITMYCSRCGAAMWDYTNSSGMCMECTMAVWSGG